METILPWTGKEITEGKQRREFQKLRQFFFLSTQLFWQPKDEQIWYSLGSPDIDIAGSVAASTTSPSPNTKRISHSQDPSSIGLGLCALKCTNILWYKWTACGIIFFSLHSSIKYASCPQERFAVQHTCNQCSSGGGASLTKAHEFILLADLL